MGDNATKGNDFISAKFLVFLWEKKWAFMGITLFAAILAAIFSSPFFITPLFKSQVVLYPGSTNSISKALISENNSGREDILKFGEEEEAEQLLQILNSSKIRDRIIEKYDLMNHYDIDSTNKFKRTLLFKEFNSMVTFRRTQYMAVEITVKDKNPDTAASMANEIAALLDQTKTDMQRERAITGFEIVKAEFNKRSSEIKMMEDSLAKIRSFGVHDYESQAEMINRQLAVEIAKGPNSRAVKALEEKLNMLAKYGTQYVSLRDQLEHEKKQLAGLKAKYDEAKIDAEQQLPQFFTVDKAYPAEKKSYPVRWLIVVVAAAATFMMSLLVFLVVENFKHLKFSKN